MTSALGAILGRPKTVLTLMVVMLVAGIAAYLTIPKEAEPDIDVPVYYISVPQQGVSPKDAERLLIKPLETELRGLNGLKELTAIASEGHAGVVLEFNMGTDKDKVLADIRDKVNQAQAEMPADADEPTIYETNFALQPTVIVTLSGQVSERTLYSHARRLKDQIEGISTVREANLSGNREEMLEVLLDLQKLESYDITQSELLNAFNQHNQLVPAGFLDDGNARFNLKVPGLVETAFDVYSIPIKQSGEGVVTLGDVAEIRRTFKDASSYTRVNGEPAIAIEVVKRIGTNIVENNKQVREIVAEYTKEWPSTIKINFLIDRSNFIFEVLGSLQSAILTAIVLVMIIVVGSLGLRSGLLVGLAIPTSFMIGFLILAALGMTINMMVMFGMVLTVGMLVDGAIVVTEYADRKMAEGMATKEAYGRAARLMFWPVVSSTATTLAAFLPLLLWPGVSGEFMSYLPVMVIIVLSASLLTALIFIPVTGVLFGQIAAFCGKRPRILVTATVMALVAAASNFALFVTLATEERIAAAALITLLAGIVTWQLASYAIRRRAARETKDDGVAQMFSSERALDISKVPGLTGDYLAFLRLMTANLFGNIIVMVAVVAMTIGTFMAFATNNNGVEFFVDEEPDVATVFVSARGNLSATDIRDIASEVEAEVLKVAGIENVVMTASAPGGSGGNIIQLGGAQDKPGDVIATMQIELSDYCCRRVAVELFEEIRVRTANIAGIRVEVRKIEGGPPTGKDVRLEIKSNDYDQLLDTIDEVRDFFDTVEHLQDLEDGRPLPGIEWELIVDREEAGRYNAGIGSVGAMIQLITNGVLIGQYRPDDSEDEVEARVRLPRQQRSLDGLQQLRLRTANGQVPIANFVDMQARPKVSSIIRRDGYYAMDIKANLTDEAKASGLTPNEKVTEIQAWLDANEWPTNLQFSFRGADEEQNEAGAFLAKAAAGALFLMFIILVTQFNSFYQTVLTLSTVVLAIVGVLIGMMLTGQKFSIIMTGTGVVALAGIVVNNAIVLIDTYNRLRSEGVDVHEAVLKTAAQRLRPIMLTTVTTIFGLIPMALSINVDFINQIVRLGSITAIWWVQLSTAVISGLAFSTMLTLIMIPVMLTVPANLATAGVASVRGARWTGAKFSLRRKPKPASPVDAPVLQPVLATDLAAGTATPSKKIKKKPGGKTPSFKDAAE